MKPFSNKRTKRNTAVAAVLLWLFALSSGIANACLLVAPATHTHTHLHVAKLGSVSHHAHDGLTGHPKAVEASEHDSDVSKDACRKVCEDGAKASVKLQASFDLLDTGMPPLLAVAWDQATPLASAPSRLDDLRPPILGPPLRVRYSRLAL